MHSLKLAATAEAGAEVAVEVGTRKAAGKGRGITTSRAKAQPRADLCLLAAKSAALRPVEGRLSTDEERAEGLQLCHSKAPPFWPSQFQHRSGASKGVAENFATKIEP